jgi:seryl-tRNA synthetase
MHDIKWIRNNLDAFGRSLTRRGVSDDDRDRILRLLVTLDERRHAVIRRLEHAQARRNVASREIGEAKKKGDQTGAQALIAEVAHLKSAIHQDEEEEHRVVAELKAALAELPNVPLDDVPDGWDERDNVEHHRYGAKPTYPFAAKQHFELGEALGLMDFETAAKLSGSRFVVLTGPLARLERALAQFMLDIHVAEHGYTEIAPPLLVRDDAMFGTAQLPKFRNDQFVATTADAYHKAIEQAVAEVAAGQADNHRVAQRMNEIREGLWLIPTAEVPLTNLVRENILDEDQLPMRFTASTACFRAEAGAAGKDTQGMIRQHQFTKVELVSITTPEQSRDEHARMLACAEEVLRRLDLHYRVVTLCTGDTGFASQKTYDIEVWLPGQGAYREISSCSVCGEFQARRMNARYRPRAGGGVRHVHTLNGSGVAVGRAVIAVMETYQQADGSIAVPERLRPYMGGLTRIERSA